MCQPVAHNDGYNADTVAPTIADKYIDSITELHLQNELRWRKYLSCLRQGAWDDYIYIAMQAISDTLSVTIHVLSSYHPMYSVTPSKDALEIVLKGYTKILLLLSKLQI